ncbi:MAG: hypothetical protein GF353_05125 [Candidatus Lokiarchaeota archaeon]|nr:hypothetical protein [Candidatus Lokiarchaeota archaeon]
MRTNRLLNGEQTHVKKPSRQTEFGDSDLPGRLGRDENRGSPAGRNRVADAAGDGGAVSNKRAQHKPPYQQYF